MRKLSTFILLLLLCFGVSQLGVVEAENVMSFDEAVDIVYSEELNFSGFPEHIGNFRLLSDEFPEQDIFVDARGITGFLVWLAPNGTYYQVEYQSGKVLGKFGDSFGVEYDSSDGYTFWWLSGREGLTYWVDAFDGSLIWYSPPRGKTPGSSGIYLPYLILLVVSLLPIVVIATTMAFVYKRRKRAKQRSQLHNIRKNGFHLI